MGQATVRVHSGICRLDCKDQTAYLKQENEIRALYVEKQGHLATLDEQIAERGEQEKHLGGHDSSGMWYQRGAS